MRGKVHAPSAKRYSLGLQPQTLLKRGVATQLNLPSRPQYAMPLQSRKPMKDLRIFVGYSSWVPGQLESEVARGDWTLAPTTSSAVFDDKPERRWRDLSPAANGQRALNASGANG